MGPEKETAESIESRINVLKKALVSEENSVLYYQTLIEKTQGDSEAERGTRRMYEDLEQEEIKHVKTIRSLLEYWTERLASSHR